MQKSKEPLKARPITNNVFSELPLQVVIPFKNNHVDVSKLLDEIYAIKNVRLSITLVDDNSSNPVFIKQYEHIPFVSCHRFDEDKGFGYCVNHAVKNGKPNIVFVMHSDVYALPKNIFRDLALALHYGVKDKVAMVSAMVDKPMPKSCKELIINPNADTDKYYELLQSDAFSPLICTAFSKTAFAKVGGLPSYPYCWYEDKLLNEKFRAFGYNVGISTRVTVRHHGGKTISELLQKKPAIAEIIKSNKTRYLSESELLKAAAEKIKK